MIRTIVTWLLVAALAAAVLFAIVHGYELWRDAKVAEGDKQGAARVQALWNEERRESDRTTLLSIELARQEERNSAAKAVQGEVDARKRAEEKAAADGAAAMRSAVAHRGLSSHLAALDAAAREAGAPDAAACPGEFAKQRDAAILARGLFGSCAAEYRSMAEDADGAIAGVTLKLDTALSYIRAIDPSGAAP